MRLILASNSKTRKDIFDMVGWKYEVITSKVEEHSKSIDPEQYVIDLSKDKANSVVSQISDKALIVAADSIIYMDNKKFEKPKSKEEGFENIKKMSGKVNYAVTNADFTISKEERKASLKLTIDTRISPVLDYFEIFMDRTMMSKHAAKYLGIWFELIINDTKLL